MADERKTVRVACTIPNGLELRIQREGHDDGSGVRHMVYVGDPVVVRGPEATSAGVNQPAGELVTTEVDAGFFATWLAQHENDPLVTQRAIYAIDDAAERRQAPEPEEPPETDREG